MSEVTLDTIFECLVEYFGVNDQTAQILKKIEIETERDVCRRNEFIFSVYNYCRENQKQIIFISDMYLLSVINKILHAAGYDQSDNLFLSSAIGKTKFMGDIYPYVLEQL
ncbi:MULTISPECIES: hypothetical protein [Moorena]|uniref:Uncharacterized protein n=1 Tax=Moorena producens 3L TaxID=489825 RepID=F4XTW2_9CYAN|nr:MULTISPECIES: hypothetical protein [Moorena]EGJ31938.1 hypothetical protein LYNGBM3L_31270 [Moorena producens 3L]NEP31644.1 hypothetical protein [Moorena sp. SIO3B2]NEP64302.1 hypothetical protein [Moorena sp. SIO3A5]NER89169.1 hypothetical protein [Moorena sp. SIO3A2]OLT67199.1 hypothetical protein BI334_21185 [Moorena producens 3L]